MSKHSVDVVRVESVLPHGNADMLEIVPVAGYTAIVRKGQFKPGDLAVYIEPDYVVSLEDQRFAFLKKPGSTKTKHRITVQKLRGIRSQGLLLPAETGMSEGDNVMESLGITRWEPSLPRSQGKGAGGSLGGGLLDVGPEFEVPYYDLENLLKYHKILSEGEEVLVTEKLHGANARFLSDGTKLWCGSRTTWKKSIPDYFATWVSIKVTTKEEADTLLDWFAESMQRAFGVKRDSDTMVFGLVNLETLEELRGKNPDWTFEEKGEKRRTQFSTAWNDAALQNPWIEEWCKKHPGMVLYGEIIGTRIQGEVFSYGYTENQVGFRVFDIFNPSEPDPSKKFLDNAELHRLDNPLTEGLQLVPLVYKGPFNMEFVKRVAEEDSAIGSGQIREGLVIKPLVERIHEKIGRVALKYVSDRYYERS